MKKPKLLKGKALTNKLDNIIRLIFKELYGENPTCFICSHKDGWFKPRGVCPHGIQVGHYIARGCTALRWELINLFPQCSGCNIYHNTNPAPFTMAIIKKVGQGRIEELERIAREAVGNKITESQKREKLEQLTAYYQSLTNGSISAKVIE